MPRVLYALRHFWYDLTMDQESRQRAMAFRDAFFQRNPTARDVIGLFEYLPSVCFYAKDAGHRYVGVNRATLTEVFGLDDEADLLGRTDNEFQPPALAEAYHAEDRRVMEGGQPIPNQVWLVPHVRGTPRWYVSTKTPLHCPDRKVLGIAGVMYPIATPEDQATYFRELSPVIKHLGDHYAEDVSMKELAALANLSTTQFNHRFRTILRMSPTEYLLSLRIQHARHLLTQTSQSIAETGTAVGFYDLSHFTKRFRKVTGMTPRAYRTRFR
jgi:AraC-like DNA-binding protein